jgi:hypothetical protein
MSPLSQVNLVTPSHQQYLVGDIVDVEELKEVTFWAKIKKLPAERWD